MDIFKAIEWILLYHHPLGWINHVREKLVNSHYKDNDVMGMETSLFLNNIMFDMLQISGSVNVAYLYSAR